MGDLKKTLRAAWDWFCCNEPPRAAQDTAMRLSVITERARRRKRDELNRAFKTGDIETVRRLTKELSQQ